jgi:hypothetical protein
MKYLPIPASTLKFTCILVRHMTVWPLLRLFARSWRFPTISEYKWGTTEPLEHSSDQLIGCFYHTTRTVQKHGATTAKRPLLSPRSRPRPPRRHKTCPLSPPTRYTASRRPLWMAAVRRWMREGDGSPWSSAFCRCFLTRAKMGWHTPFLRWTTSISIVDK